MLFTDIKTYFIESEEEKGEEESYIEELQSTHTIETMIEKVCDYHSYDEFEASNYILVQVCKF